MKKLKKKGYLFKICAILLMCIFSFATFSACGEVRTETSSSAGGSTGTGGQGGAPGTGGSTGSGGGGNSSSGNTGSGSGNTSGGGTGSGSSTSNKKVAANKINEYLMGAIAVYENTSIDVNPSFYDQFTGINMTYGSLLDRQFTTMAEYISASLFKFYGPVDSEMSSIALSHFSSQVLGFDKVINNSDEKSFIAGEKPHIKYTNAINGGYQLVIQRDADDNFAGAYYGSELLQGQTINNEKLPNYKWKIVDIFNNSGHLLTQESLAGYITKALAQIYVENLGGVTISNIDSDINISSNSNLRNMYSNFSNSFQNSDEGYDFAKSKITNSGLSREFLWHVAYFIGHTIIGSNNITNSSSSHSKIYSNGNYIALDEESKVEDYEKYKGYHIVIPELVENLSKLELKDGSIGYNSSGYFDDSSDIWKTTLFPYNSRDIYVYYDNVEEICDANNVSYFEGDPIVDRDSNSGSSSGKVSEIGEAVLIKKIILLPKNISEDHKNEPWRFYYLSAGFRTTDEDYDNYKLKIYADVMFDSHNNSDSNYDAQRVVSTLATGDINNKLEEYTLYYDYKESGPFAIFGFDLKEDLRDAQWKPVDGVEELITTQEMLGDIGSLEKPAFIRTGGKTVNYASGKTRNLKTGTMSSHNRIHDLNGELNFGKNHIVLNFEYYTPANAPAKNIIPTNVMWFIPRY